MAAKSISVSSQEKENNGGQDTGDDDIDEKDEDVNAKIQFSIDQVFTSIWLMYY